jgi:hypothetical protein
MQRQRIRAHCNVDHRAEVAGDVIGRRFVDATARARLLGVKAYSRRGEAITDLVRIIQPPGRFSTTTAGPGAR